MLIQCPKCGFEQPQDQFCAQCGVEIGKYESLWSQRLKRFFRNEALIALALVGTLIASWFVLETVRNRQRQRVLQSLSEIEIEDEIGTDVLAESEAPAPELPPEPVANQTKNMESPVVSEVPETEVEKPVLKGLEIKFAIFSQSQINSTFPNDPGAVWTPKTGLYELVVTSPILETYSFPPFQLNREALTNDANAVPIEFLEPKERLYGFRFLLKAIESDDQTEIELEIETSLPGRSSISTNYYKDRFLVSPGKVTYVSNLLPAELDAEEIFLAREPRPKRQTQLLMALKPEF